MLFSSRPLQWLLALLLLCWPPPLQGRPQGAPPHGAPPRGRRSVAHTQLMHDKSRTLQDVRRRLWLQELLDVVHTAEIRDLPARPPLGPAPPPGAAAAAAATPPGATGGTLHAKPPGGAKHLAPGVPWEEEGGGVLPQETARAPPYKDGVLRAPGKRRKKGRGGKRREGEKRKRRARSPGPPPEGSGLPRGGGRGLTGAPL